MLGGPQSNSDFLAALRNAFTAPKVSNLVSSALRWPKSSDTATAMASLARASIAAARVSRSLRVAASGTPPLYACALELYEAMELGLEVGGGHLVAPYSSGEFFSWRGSKSSQANRHVLVDDAVLDPRCIPFAASIFPTFKDPPNSRESIAEACFWSSREPAS